MFRFSLSLGLMTLFCATSALATSALAMPDAHQHMAGHHNAPAQSSHAMHQGHGGAHHASAPAGLLKAEVVKAPVLQPGQPAEITLRLLQGDDKTPLPLDAVKEVHTRKIHLLIIDPTLTDYHHVHPLPTQVPGEYRFTFTPQKTAYQIWADVTPLATGKQEYVRAALGQPDAVTAKVDETPRMVATVAGSTFTLALAETPQAGKPVMASITVTRNGQPFRKLEPVMGAFAHLVGFAADGQSVMHVHPMGQEPASAADRGGPVLQFHITPEAPGFVKLFAQFLIDGQDVFVPFGVVVR